MQESRKTSRYTFSVEQKIARIVGGELPTLDAFESVRCADISRCGFSFYQPTRPDFAELVVALGLAPDLVYLVARVVHAEMIEMCGSLIFRVGCCFTGSAQWDDQTQTFVAHDDVEAALLFLAER
ncbi:MAG: hypothetical protein ACYC6N_32065 [Pirellulaceae bacterium]